MTISQAIQQKVLAVSRQAPSLRKGDRNNDAGFSFVSIDDYYEQVASLAADLGLGWTVVEEGIDIVPIDDKTIVLQKFRVDVFETQTGAVAEGYFKLTIPAPFSDAQTAGISVSYLDKCFMRSAFKIVTGEKDADHMAKGRAKPPPKSAERQSEVQRAEPKPKAKPAEAETKPDNSGAGPASDLAAIKAISARMLEALDAANSIADLDQFRLDEQGDLNKLKAAAKGSKDADLELQLVQKKYKSLYDAYEAEGEVD